MHDTKSRGVARWADRARQDDALDRSAQQDDSDPTLPSHRPLIISSVVAVLATIAVLPVSHYQLSASASFVTAMLAVVACFDLMSVYLLLGDYRSRGDPRLLMMSWAYGWSLVLMCGYALAFPGAVTVHPLLAVTSSMAPYLYIAWHCGFPVLLAAAWAPWPHRWLAPTPRSRRRLVSVVTLTIAVTAGVLLVVALYAAARHLPVLIQGLDTHRMTALTAPFVLPLVAVALATAVLGTRGRTGPERWSAIAVLICLCDLCLTYYARSRYSLGWYCGRSLTLVAAAVVLLAMLNSFRRMKAQAEHDATVDPLTGLGNRRSAAVALDQLVARSRRSGLPLGILSLDLDFFKHINDRYGHDVGDDVLAETGRLLIRSCRVGDVVARVGGEEFLILLPDTDRRGSIVVAEKIRVALASMLVPTMPDPVTASLGVTALRDADVTTASLLRRADSALYQAKHNGRNCVVEAQFTNAPVTTRT